MSGYPIRIALRVDFSDGSQHEYEVRGHDAVDEPFIGTGFYPAAVTSPDIAARLKLYGEMREALDECRAERDALAQEIAELKAERDSGGATQ